MVTNLIKCPLCSTALYLNICPKEEYEGLMLNSHFESLGEIIPPLDVHGTMSCVFCGMNLLAEVCNSYAKLEREEDV